MKFRPSQIVHLLAKLGFIKDVHYFLISTQEQKLRVLVRAISIRLFERVPTLSVLSNNKTNITIFHLRIGEERAYFSAIVYLLLCVSVGEVSSSSGCLGWSTLFYCGTP